MEQSVGKELLGCGYGSAGVWVWSCLSVSMERGVGMELILQPVTATDRM